MTDHTNSEPVETVQLSTISEFNHMAVRAARDIVPLKGKVYDVTDPNGMAEAKADLKLITSFLTAFEALRKSVKQPYLDKGKEIDGEAARIAKPLEEGIKTPLRLAIQTEEQRAEKLEAERVAAVQARIAAMRQRPAWGAKAADIRAMLERVAGVDVDATFAELQDDACVAKAEALRDLRAMLEQAEAAQREADQKEQERQQALEAARQATAAASAAQALVEQQEQAASVVSGDVTSGATIGGELVDVSLPARVFAGASPGPNGRQTVEAALDKIIAICGDRPGDYAQIKGSAMVALMALDRLD